MISKFLMTALLAVSVCSCGGGGGDSSAPATPTVVVNTTAVVPVAPPVVIPTEVIEVVPVNTANKQVFSDSTIFTDITPATKVGFSAAYNTGFAQGSLSGIIPVYIVSGINTTISATAQYDIQQYLLGYKAAKGKSPDRVYIHDEPFWGGYTLPVPLDSELKNAYNNLKTLISLWRSETPQTKLIMVMQPGILINPTVSTYSREIVKSIDVIGYDAYEAWDLGGAMPYLINVANDYIHNVPECKDQVLTGRSIIDLTECATRVAPMPTGLVYQTFLRTDDIAIPATFEMRKTQLLSNWNDMHTVGVALKLKGRLSFVVPYGYYWSDKQTADEPIIAGGISFINPAMLGVLKNTLSF